MELRTRRSHFQSFLRTTKRPAVSRIVAPRLWWEYAHSRGAMEFRFLVVTGLACCACALFWGLLPWQKIRFRDIPGFVLVADVLLWPLMKLGAAGKITHWWDWSPVSRLDIDPEVPPLVVASQTPQQRVYKTTRWLGQYNWEGVRDLYKTLFVLQIVAVLEPESYQGFWRLLVAGNRYRDELQYEFYDRVDLLVLGKVKTLLDGEKRFLGQTETGGNISLTLVAITSRDQYPDIPFV